MVHASPVSKAVGELTCDVKGDAATVLNHVGEYHLTVVDCLVVFRLDRVQVDRDESLADVRSVDARYLLVVTVPRQSRQSTGDDDLAGQLCRIARAQLSVTSTLLYSCQISTRTVQLFGVRTHSAAVYIRL